MEHKSSEEAMKSGISVIAASVILCACGGGSEPESSEKVSLSRAAEVAAAATPSQRQVAKSFTSLDGTTSVPYLEYLPADYLSSGNKRYPLLVFLHGGSGAGASNGSEISKLLGYPIPAMIAGNHEMCFTNPSGRNLCFIVVSPQSPRTTGVWDIRDTGGMLEHALKSYRVDPKRVYVTGVSMGGGGTWTLAAGTYTDGSQTIQGASRITAAIPIASGARSAAYNTGICSGIVGNHIPMWAFHNSGDPIASLANEQGWVDKVNLTTNADGYTCTQAGNPSAQLTIYQSNTHEGWTTTYNTSTQIAPGMNAFQWLLSKAKR